MTWENDVETSFDHDGTRYNASADVVVTMSKQDIGPIRHHEHFESYVTDDVEIKNLKVGYHDNPEDLEPIPEGIRLAAEEVISELASMRAEESMW